MMVTVVVMVVMMVMMVVVVVVMMRAVVVVMMVVRCDFVGGEVGLCAECSDTFMFMLYDLPAILQFMQEMEIASWDVPKTISHRDFVKETAKVHTARRRSLMQ
jgi:hypothetical protein